MGTRHRRTVRLRLLILVWCVAGLAVRLPADALGGMPSFGGLVSTGPSGTQWAETEDGAVSLIVDARRVDGSTTRHLVVERYTRAQGFASTVVYTDSGGATIRRAGTVSLPGADLGILSVSAGTTDMERGLIILDLARLERDGLRDLHDHDGSVSIGSFRSEQDWQAVALGEDLLIVRVARVDAGTVLLAHVLTQIDSGGWAEAPASPWVLHRSERVIRTPAVSVEPGESVALTWLEEDTAGDATLIAATMPATSFELTLLGSEEFGRAELGALGSGVPRDIFGHGSDVTSRESTAIGLRGGIVCVVADEITRPRSQLSEFRTRPVIVRFSLNGGTPVKTVITSESAGVVNSAFALSGAGDTLRVTFLREYLGEPIQSDVFGVTVDPFTGRTGPVTNLTRTARRVISPLPVTASGTSGLVWLQAQPEASGYLAVHRDENPSLLVTMFSLHVEGNAAESVAAAVLTVPVAALLSAVWGIVGNAPLLAIIWLMVFCVYRWAPLIVRERYRLVTAALFVIAGVMTGTPWLSLFAPERSLVSHLLATALAVGAVLAKSALSRPVASGSTRRIPSDRETVRRAMAVVVLVTALESYPAVAALLSGVGLLPAVL